MRIRARSLRGASAFKVLVGEGGRGSSGQKRNKNLPREQDVALIFIREKRGCCAEEREDEISKVGEREGRNEMQMS